MKLLTEPFKGKHRNYRPYEGMMGIGCHGIVFSYNDIQKLLEGNDGQLRDYLERLSCRFMNFKDDKPVIPEVDKYYLLAGVLIKGYSLSVKRYSYIVVKTGLAISSDTTLALDLIPCDENGNTHGIVDC